MNRHFGKVSRMSFANARIDADITLDDGTNFYIKKKTGFLKIKFDKEKNTADAYYELKALGTDLKSAIQ